MYLIQTALTVLSGAVVGFSLGLIGGGGSIMAIPMLTYIVGLQPHVAIGTGALAVSVNAFSNFVGHARAGNVRWRNAIVFAVVGALGAAFGSILGKKIDGERLLFLFAMLMIVVGLLMLRRGRSGSRAPRDGGPIAAAWGISVVIGTALAVGLLAGFFGIGGGFLIVPGLLFSTGMPMICAVGSSLLAVGSFGLTTAGSYALSGLVDWPVAAQYIVGGVLGGLLGTSLACRLAARKAVLSEIFSVVVFAVAAYMLYRNAASMGLR